MANRDEFVIEYPLKREELDATKLHISFRSKEDGTSAEAELRGRVHDPNDETNEVRANDFVRKVVHYGLEYSSQTSGSRQLITILETTPLDYQQKVRVSATKSSSRVSLAQVFASLLLLPEPSGRKGSVTLPPSGLIRHGYWIEMIDFQLESYLTDQDGGSTLVATKIYIATRQEVYEGARILNYSERLNVLRETLEVMRREHSSSRLLRDALSYYIDVYDGKKPFVYQTGVFAANIIMQHCSHLLTKIGCTQDSDPFDVLTKLVALPMGDCVEVGAQPVAAASGRIDKPRNLVFFGAPGTGKSYQLNKAGVRTKNNPEGLFYEGNVRRVTFYPDYTYSQFVGSYRPFTEAGEIGYRYIAGPFLETYLDASLHPNDDFLLIIEELNRANPATVFGDVFQLLDRDSLGASEYRVTVPLEMRGCINDRLAGLSDIEKEAIEEFYDPDLDFNGFCNSMLQSLALPPNMFIWATMNSADQGVFPMDTAFKRRWDFRYVGIDEGEDAAPSELGGCKLSEYAVLINGKRVLWNELRKGINVLLLDNGVNEDKLLGPFFLSPEALSDELYGDGAKSRFINAFEDKVLLYLYEDAGKMRRKGIFRDGGATFASICAEFEHKGVEVFEQSTERHKDIFASTRDCPDEAVSPAQVDGD